MKPVRLCLATIALLVVLGGAASAECLLSDAKLEKAIQKRPQLRSILDRQNIWDLRTLRDAAFTL